MRCPRFSIVQFLKNIGEFFEFTSVFRVLAVPLSTSIVILSTEMFTIATKIANTIDAYIYILISKIYGTTQNMIFAMSILLFVTIKRNQIQNNHFQFQYISKFEHIKKYLPFNMKSCDRHVNVRHSSNEEIILMKIISS